ncbi:MAG: alkaline phosphatase family protein [Saprospiraceae bacterium]
MKNFILIVLCIFLKSLVFSQATLPVPAHIVIVILENHGFSQIIGSSSAPYINQLAYGPNSALFLNSFALTHPSQPNYIDFYSGCNQGVTNDNFPQASPFTTDNLGSQLINAGKTFVTYSEDLPSVGFNGGTSGKYARKHNPAANWMGNGINQIPGTTNQPFTAFPTTDFEMLPTVSYVIPNLDNDMHNGSEPAKVTKGDTWLYNKLDSYVKWADKNNSLFILTFDENENTGGNRITTMMTGQSVLAGQYNGTINHYSVLRTIEDMYELPHACKADSATAITYIWKMSTTTDHISSGDIGYSIYPNPAHDYLTIEMNDDQLNYNWIFTIYSLMGKEEISLNLNAFHNVIPVSHLDPGLYFYQMTDGNKSLKTGKLIIQ